MSKKALVAISFGTSYLNAQNAIVHIEEKLRESMPDADFFRAFTSRMIINKLALTKNIHVPTPVEIMDQLVEEGYDEVVCQTLHIIPGVEYEKMKAELSSYNDRFQQLTIGTPLLYNCDDYLICANAVLSHIPTLAKDEALVLMGHGSEHFSNSAYSQLENTFRVIDADNVYVGTVEGFPDFNYVLSRLQKKGVKKALLLPFMIVAGDHAQNDLAGDDSDSWKSMLQQAGFSVRVQLSGLGEFDEIADLIVSHMKSINK